MGIQDAHNSDDALQLRAFTKCLLQDVRALERMLDEGLFESGIRRIGAEQELFLVDKQFQPAPLAIEMLEALNDSHFTPELARFNLEYNLEPIVFGAKCLSELEKDLRSNLEKASKVANSLDAELLLTGILPTLQNSHMDPSNMTPRPRYYALEEALRRLRGGPYDLRIKGIDEIFIKTDSCMFEACNTSFQVHFQVAPSEFAHFYNIAELVAAPMLAIATNSPLLFGKRLWSETRIALFGRTVDTRRSSPGMRELRPRVSFGKQWINDSVLEIFRDDISSFKILFSDISDEDPLALLDQNKIPKLKALRLHNGTVYRWNRPCYGISDGKAHLRIENRVIPAGPTVIDEVANAAFWFGMISAISNQFDDVSAKISFEEVQNNFIRAARNGLGAELRWIDGRKRPAYELVSEVLAPMAREALVARGLDANDVERYLSVIEKRSENRQTGSQWIIDSLLDMRGEGTKAERLSALTAGMSSRQQIGEPCHSWSLAKLNEAGGWKNNYVRVEQYMTTDLYTVSEDQTIDLVANLMDWQNIRHILVEDDNHKLIGLVSYRAVLRYFAKMGPDQNKDTTAVSEITTRDPISVSPETSTIEAIRILRKNRISCLPVVKDGKLVGVVTEADFTEMARALLIEKLEE